MIKATDCYAAYDPEQYDQAIPLYLAPEEKFDQWLEEVSIDHLLLAKANNFKGGAGEVLIAADAVFIGLGQGADPFVAGAAAAKLPAGEYHFANPMQGHSALLHALGWTLGAYKFSRYKQVKDVPTLILNADDDFAALDRLTRAVWMTRDLVNTPTEDMGPDDLAMAVREVAAAHKAKVKIIEGDQLLKHNLQLIHAVGRAAEKAPRLIDLVWGDKEHPKVTLIGKGVCFDTGGLNIKSGASMGLMKKDMGGAANALGLAQMIMGADLPVRLRLLIPAVENNISSNSYRPGDVFTARNGLTVEISNTDAEGRLVLADALALAAEEEPDHILSFATLTGAARVALGPELAPAYSTKAGMTQDLANAGAEIADPVWPMPFWENYLSYLDSDIADINHAASTSFAGSITAALFLKKFVSNVPYTHFDIFAWNPKTRPGRPKGGEALGIRACFEVLKDYYK
ncbi:MAG: leucyl aminopeptidase family protein [bacterium]